ncbi:uncharacterized protein LOC121799669 isoform X2 [Salvia splendens]|uniref:uncharacterized protein LOC121799669 isoform X2 n=1 Tax=Salvia splendens TaxID=180675 RepID=UPI001C262A21|nr:uncharacterized protein LOC121799669 isoform X2 [Salvia splendens]
MRVLSILLRRLKRRAKMSPVIRMRISLNAYVEVTGTSSTRILALVTSVIGLLMDDSCGERRLRRMCRREEEAEGKKGTRASPTPVTEVEAPDEEELAGSYSPQLLHGDEDEDEDAKRTRLFW